MPRFTRRTALKLLGAAAAAGPAGALAQGRAWSPREAPNFILIMTDDQRADAFSAAGNPILKTPSIDRIAHEGIRFTEAFVTNSLCAPSRASFLTGLYSHAHGVITNGSGEVFRNQPGLRDEQITFVHLLRQAGYETALVGKWHLRSRPSAFDYWVVLPGGGGPYMDPTMTANGAPIKFRGYSDDVVGDQALAYLQQRAKDRPFCLLYNFKAPHRNWIPAPRHANAFEDVEVPVPRTFEDKYEGRPEALRRTDMAIADMPDFRDRGVPESLPPEERKRLNLQHLVKNYYRTILSVDDNIGRVLEYLDANDLSKNTVIVFTSDNGFFLGEHGFYDKRLMYEPSIRVPMLLRYPARMKPQVDTTHMVLNVDVAPTVLALAGLPVPAWMHGRSMLPLLGSGFRVPSSELRAANQEPGTRNSEPVPWRDAFYYEFFEHPDADHCVRKNRGIRTSRWKLIHFWEQPEEWELYDIRNDPDEMRNLIGERRHAGLIRDLKARMAELRRELGDADPPGPPPVALPCKGR